MGIRRAEPGDRQRLFEIWDGAVRATHHFLAEADRLHIADLVRDAYLPTAELWVAVDGQGRPLAFMGLEGGKIESLFVDAAAHGRGIGRRLVEHAREQAGALTVDVNEQNGGAVAFYRRLGFREVGRSPVDDGGRPYPLLHMAEGAVST